MTKEELVELAETIINAEGNEQEVIDNMLLFQNSVPDPKAGDYLTQVEYDHLTVEEIVEKALSYKPIQL
ncbi:hypothetical protein GCM10022393_42590 [Aquimarina addita]|uniref:Colicin immunity protein/pyocin immunity protein n=1 Tax=Aquimarina addita TaxID=870485 RepID=A0ABP6UV73_9FLAO